MVGKWRYWFQKKGSKSHPYHVDANGIDAAKKQLSDPTKWRLVGREKWVNGKLKHHR
jgi:hypothetical protein